jgi:iron complex outermembrane receptor protein
MLRGDQRDFVNTFQPERGLSVDTRGTPIATLFTLTTLQTALSRDNIDNTGRNTGPVDPANANLRVAGINIVDLPTGPGYAGLDGMGPYDEVLWASPAAKYGSAWDTGRAAVLQQPVRNTNFVARGTFKLGEHRFTAEAIVGRSESTKSFSANQISSVATGNSTLPNGTPFSNPFSNLAYPSTGADYARVFNALVAYFPALEPNRGLPLAFRWRALPSGNREIATESNTRRYLVGAEGPLGFLSEWEYRLGGSQASSESESELVNGYFYTVGFADLINRGILNPFSYTQTPEALRALEGVMARGVKLYGGEFTTEQADATFSGPLWKLARGTIMAAVGADVRVEKYVFNGDQRPNANDPAAQVFNAPFDNTLATAGTLKRTIKAGFVELQVPLLKGLDLNPAVRTDHYTGFGRTTNPKVTLRYAPTEKFLVRGTYSTGFRVPTFKQMFDPIVETQYAGNDIPDPASGRPIGPDNPAIKPVILTGGKSNLQPEEADMYSAGIVFAPNRHISGNIDWWSIDRIGTIQSFGVTTLVANYSLFPDRFFRNPAGELVAIDNRWVNAGETKTKGIEFGLRGDMDALRGKIAGGFDLSYLLEKRSRLIPSAPFSASEVGRFTRSSDIGIKWKHSAFVSYRRGNWSGLLQHLFRGHYVDAVLPGVANGSVRPPNWDSTVDSYSIFNVSLTYRGFKNFAVIAGIKNVLDTDPPFSAAYDTNTGAGSSWEPRVADPRGRSFTLQVQYKFF